MEHFRAWRGSIFPLPVIMLPKPPFRSDELLTERGAADLDEAVDVVCPPVQAILDRDGSSKQISLRRHVRSKSGALHHIGHGSKRGAKQRPQPGCANCPGTLRLPTMLTSAL